MMRHFWSSKFFGSSFYLRNYNNDRNGKQHMEQLANSQKSTADFIKERVTAFPTYDTIQIEVQKASPGRVMNEDYVMHF